jgi:hypothetical protein
VATILGAYGYPGQTDSAGSWHHCITDREASPYGSIVS